MPPEASGPPTAPRWLRRLAGPAARRWLRLDVAGVQHVPAHGPVIIAPTHRSHADAVAVGAATSRPLTYLGSAHLGDIRGVGRLLGALGLVVVRRGEADAGALDRCVGLLDAGAALVVFPEGGRSRDGCVYRPRSGVARLAAAAGCPVVPVGLRGTSRAWPPGGLPRPAGARVEVRFGPVLAPPAADPAPRREFSGRLHAELVRLSGHPPARGFLAERVA